MLENTELKVLNISDVLPNRFQPRLKFEKDSLEQLAASINKFGVIEPIVVRPVGSKFEIIAGERRYKASKLASKSTIPAIIIRLSDKDSEELALLENVQRQSLNPIEEAVSYKRILDSGYITREELAKKIGKPQVMIFNKIKLLSLSDEVQNFLLNGKISERHARSLLKLTNLDDQNEMLHRIVNERLTVKSTDKEIKKILDSSASSNNEDVELLALNERGNNMDLDKIMREAQDINPNVSPEAQQVGPNLMAANTAAPSEPIVQQAQPTTQVSSDVDNKFVNITAQPVQPVVTPSPVDESPSFDSMFNKPLENVSPAAPLNNGTVNNGEVINSQNNISSVVADAFQNLNNGIVDNAKFVNVPDTSINEPLENTVSSLPGTDGLVNDNGNNVSGQVNEQINSTSLTPGQPLSSSSETVVQQSNVAAEQVRDIPDLPFNTNVNVNPGISSPNDSIVSPANVVGQESTNKAGFANIVQLLRDCANQIEQNGYFVNVDEMDLGNQYKVTFTIDK